MVRSTVKTISYTSGSRKVNASRKVVARARALLRGRMASGPRAPLRTGGFYGLYQQRGRNELKFIDVTSSGTTATAGAVTLLNGVATGTDITNRIGRKIMMKSILFRLDLQTTATSLLGDFIRVLVVYDCQTNTTTPAVTDVIVNNYNSPMNLSNRDRFKVLIDKHVIMNACDLTGGVVAGGDPMPKYVKVYKKMNLEVIFGGVNSNVGSINTGGIFLVLVSQNNALTTATLYSRIRFEDS